MGAQAVRKDWLRGIDWTRSNAELAEKYGVSWWQARNHRLRFFRMLHTWGSFRRYGVSKTHVTLMRKKYGVPQPRRRKKRLKPKKIRTPTPPGQRGSSEALRLFVLEAIDAGNTQAMLIHDYVLNTWGYTAKRTTFGALAHLIWLDEIMYTQSDNGIRLYMRKGTK